jgi:hypothetical protein
MPSPTYEDLTKIRSLGSRNLIQSQAGRTCLRLECYTGVGQSLLLGLPVAKSI